MTTSISRAQNLPENVDLLVAQRRLYSDAKAARAVRAFGSLIAAVPLPILAALVPSSRSPVTALGGVWLLVALVLMVGFERRKTSQGTRVLEEFDVRVFGLPWNGRIAGKRVVREVIANATRRSRVDRTKLEDWYPPVVDRLAWPLSVLVCQRGSVVWDWRLRRAYSCLLIALTLGLLAASVAAAVLLRYTTLQWLLVLALPMAAALTGGAHAALKNLADAAEQSEMHDRLDDDWRRALEAANSVTPVECRQHQDCRYAHRLKATPIPDWWYGVLRGRYEVDMRAAADLMVCEFLSHSSQEARQVACPLTPVQDEDRQ